MPNLQIAKSCLRLVGEMVIPQISAPVDPDSYFRSRRSVVEFCGDGFRKIIYEAAQLSVVPATKIAVFEVTAKVGESQMLAELPKGHAFRDASLFCAMFAEIVGRQPNGGSGLLLTKNLGVNIFHVQVGGELFSVDALWLSGSNRWSLAAYGRTGSDEEIGTRIFSTTTWRPPADA